MNDMLPMHPQPDALRPVNPLVPTNFEQALKLAEYLAASTMVPKDFQGKAANCLIAMQWGYELNVGCMQAIQNIAVINGRPSIWGDLGLALVKRHPDYEWIKEEPDAQGCTVTLKRRGEPEVIRTFTLHDAQRAGLASKDTYKAYPARMLQMRARWWAMRDAFPDALKGMPSAEEALEKDMGRAEQVTETSTPPISRAQAVKAKLKKLPDAKPAETAKEDAHPALLEEVIAAIQRADTPDALRAAAVMAQKLTNGDELPAREAYSKRLAELKALETKAAEQSHRDATALTYAQVGGHINSAKDVEALAISEQLIERVQDPQHQAELRKLVEQQRARLTSGKLPF
jgi:hypothetical protein